MSQAPDNAIKLNIALRWSDQDLLGHVNNAKIMTLMEEARIRVFAQLQQHAQGEVSLETVVRTATIDYLRPVAYTDAVRVNVWISRIGNSSFVMHHELLQEQQVCATLEAVMVMFDSQAQQSMTIPDALRTSFATIAS